MALIVEDGEMEAFVFSGDSDVAVPVERYVSRDGDETVTVFPSHRPVAEALCRRFSGNLLSKEADAFLREQLAPSMAALGFSPDEKASGLILELEPGDGRSGRGDEAARLMASGDRYPSLLTFTPEYDEDCPVAVVIRDGKIVSAAQVNDLSLDGAVEINVETAPAYRRQGLAASAVRVLTACLLRAGEGVVYCCRESNTGSRKTAAAAGFVPKGWRKSFVCYRRCAGEIGDPCGI